MPVILSPESYALWLDLEVKSREELDPLIEPFPDKNTVIRPVNRDVNNPANDSPSMTQLSGS
jgi:putative SOS response-associated peptidase YedK